MIEIREGYIAPDSKLDAMYEVAVDRMWEEMQPKEMEAEDPYTKFSFNTLNDAWACLETSMLDFEGIQKFVDMAMGQIEGTPEHDKLGSIYDSVMDLQAEVMKIKALIRKKASEASEREWN